MNSYVPIDGIPAYVVVPAQYAQQVYAGMERNAGTNLRCVIRSSSRPNNMTNEFINGDSEMISFGPDRYDFDIEFVALGTETMMLVERIIRNNIPVYIYPIEGGGLQYSVPLLRSLNTDPVDASLTDSFALDAATKLYFPEAVAGRGHRYVESSDGLPLRSDVYGKNCTPSLFPLEAGYAMYKPQKNLIKMSELNTITSSAPYAGGWEAHTTAADVWGTDHGKADSPWLPGGYTWWTTSDTAYLISPKFDILSNTRKMNLSFSYRCDHVLYADLIDSSGTRIELATLSAGEGRAQLVYETITGSASDCRVKFSCSSDTTYAEIGHFQLINGGSVAVTEYEPYLATTTAAEGELDASGLLLAGDFSASCQKSQAFLVKMDTCIAVSGLFQPGFDSDSRGTGQTLAFLERILTTSQGDCEIRFDYGGAVLGLEFTLVSGGTRRGGSSVTGHKQGDVYGWVLFTGLDEGAKHTTVAWRRMRDGATGSYEYTGGGLMYANRLYIGCRSTAGYQCNGNIGAVQVQTCAYSAAAALADKMGNSENLDIMRRTAGRWYYLSDGSTYRKHTRNAYDGIISARQMRAL